jgi:hypothetical protein
MSDIDQAKEFLHIAKRELRALKGMLDEKTFADEIFGFVGQQAVEKSVSWAANSFSPPFPTYMLR